MAARYNPGIRNIAPRRLSNAEKMIRNFEKMPPAIQQSWIKNPRNRKRLEDAYMLVETPEPPVEPEETGPAPNPFNPQGPDPTGPGGALEIPAHIRPDETPMQGPHGALPDGRTAYDDYLDSLRNRGLSGDPRTGVLF